MAIRASDQVTLQVLATPSYIRTYYLLQSSTLTPPAKPTTNPPAAPWSLTEPGYTAGSTSTLYTVQLSVWGNGEFEYGPVQKSSAYEAAKQAYNAAQAAADAANQAAADAATAKTTADGKSRIILSSTRPMDAPTQLKQGDLWYILDVTTGGLSGINIWNGQDWQPYRLVVDQLVVPGSVGTVSIADGAVKTPQLDARAVTADKFAVGVLNGQELYGNYIEAPVIASSAETGKGANLLNDPDVTSSLDTAWVASGFLGEGTPTQTDTITWDQTATVAPGKTYRYKGNVIADMSVLPITRKTGTITHRRTLGLFSTTNRTINNPYPYSTSPLAPGITAIEEPALAAVDVTTPGTGTTVTSYLTNSAIIPLTAGQPWMTSINYICESGLGSIQIVEIQLVNATTSSVVWSQQLTQDQIRNGSSVFVNFTPTTTANVKFRIMVQYRYAGGGVTRPIRAGGVRSGTASSPDGTYFNYSLRLDGNQLAPEDGSPVGGSAVANSREWTTANASQIFARANAGFELTAAFLGQSQPKAGYRLSGTGGLELFNAIGARTGRLNGDSNYLAGTFATSESGQRLQMDNQRLEWYNAAGTLTTYLDGTDVGSLKNMLTGATRATDWNDAVAPGNYYSTNSATNVPEVTGTGGYIGRVITNPSLNSLILQELAHVDSSGNVTRRWERARTTFPGTWGAWRPVGASGLPEAWIGAGNSGVAVTAGTAWGAIPGILRLEWPAMARDLIVDVTFGALGITNAGYWMVGVQASSKTGSPAWSVGPEEKDPTSEGIATGAQAYGLYAPFSQATQQVQLSGTKRYRVPAGVAPVFQMVSRKSSSSAVATMNYTSMQVTPVRWG